MQTNEYGGQKTGHVPRSWIIVVERK